MSRREISQATPGDQAVALLRQLDGLKTDEPRIAQVGERLVARAIDSVLWVMVVFGLFDLGLFIWMASQGKLSDVSTLQPKHSDPAVSTVLGIVLFVAAFAYCVIPVARSGQTLGKRLMGLVVVTDEMQPVGWRQAIARFAAWEGPGIILMALFLPTEGAISTALALAGIAWTLAMLAPAVFDEGRRGWHDRLAGTRVIRPR